MKLLLLAFLVALLQCTLVKAYAKGAPPEACGDMEPKHGHTPLPLNSFPYKVHIDKTSITPGDTVKVTISGAKFKGFFVQARVGNTPIGQFEAGTDIGLVNCAEGVGTAATHTGPEPKQTITVSWKSPEKLSETVIFWVTVAEDGSKYWVGHKSEPVTVV